MTVSVLISLVRPSVAPLVKGLLCHPPRSKTIQLLSLINDNRLSSSWISLNLAWPLQLRTSKKKTLYQLHNSGLAPTDSIHDLVGRPSFLPDFRNNELILGRQRGRQPPLWAPPSFSKFMRSSERLERSIPWTRACSTRIGPFAQTIMEPKSRRSRRNHARWDHWPGQKK